MRFGERMGERAMYRRAEQIRRAFENATGAAREAAEGNGTAEHPAEWAKLDMAEFQGIEDYAGIKETIEEKLQDPTASTRRGSPSPPRAASTSCSESRTPRRYGSRSTSSRARPTRHASARRPTSPRGTPGRRPRRGTSGRSGCAPSRPARRRRPSRQRAPPRARQRGDPACRRCGRDDGRTGRGGSPGLHRRLPPRELVRRMPALASGQPRVQPHGSGQAPSSSARPRPPLARGCRARDGARGRLRRVVRLGMVAHARKPGATGRGARQRPLGHRPRGQAIHESRGPRQKHRPHEALRDGDGPARPRPALRAQPERARGGRLRLREDERALRAQHHAAELELPRDRPEGRDAAPDGAHARSCGIQDTGVQYGRLLQVPPLQPPGVRPRRSGHPRVRVLPHREHDRRPRARGRPLLGERREAPLRGAHRVPGVPLPARRPLAVGGGHPALPREGEGIGRVVPQPARLAFRGGGDRDALRRGGRRERPGFRPDEEGLPTTRQAPAGGSRSPSPSPSTRTSPSSTTRCSRTRRERP